MTESPRFITLRARGQDVAVDAASIRQIVPASGLIQVPLARAHVAGVLPREGRAIPVYRLAALSPEREVQARDEEGEEGIEARQIVIFEHDGALAGFLVEGTDSVRRGATTPAMVLDGRAMLSAAGVLEPARGDQAAQAAEGES